MKSIIEEIYYSNRGNSEVIEAEEGYWQVHKEYDKIFETLQQGLNDEQKKLLNELFIQGGGLEGELARTHYKEGFKLGMLIAFEVLSE